MNQISPLAFVHPEAKLGDNNIIGPFCYIDRDTVIGDNNIKTLRSILPFFFLCQLFDALSLDFLSFVCYRIVK